MKKIYLFLLMTVFFCLSLHAGNTDGIASPARKIILISSDIPQPEKLLSVFTDEYELQYFNSTESPESIIRKSINNRYDAKLGEIIIFTHGSEGSFNLGNAQINAYNIKDYEPDFYNLKIHTSENAIIQIFACNTGQGHKGMELIKNLALYTNTTVYASDNITGKDGDWVLEVNSGSAKEAKSIAITDYQSNLQTVNDNRYAIRTFATNSLGLVTEIAIDQTTGDIYFTKGQTDAPMYKYNLSASLSTLGSDWTGSNWHPFGASDIEYYNGLILASLPSPAQLVTFNVNTFANTYPLNYACSNETGSAVVGNYFYTTTGNSGDLYYKINLTTWALEGTYNIGVVGNYEDLEYCSKTNKMYYISDGSPIREIYMDGSGVSAPIGIQAGWNFAVDPDGQYAYIKVGSNIIRVNLSTGAQDTFVSGLTNYEYADMEFGPSSAVPGSYSLYIGDNNRILEVYTNLTTSPVSLTGSCTPQSISVGFTAGTYNAGNVFTAQLSDATGSFSSPVNIGSLTATTSGTIAANIPIVTYGTQYRIRVISSNPATYGSDNGTDLILGDNTPPDVTCPGNISVNNDAGVCGAIVNYNVTITDNCSAMPQTSYPGYTYIGTHGNHTYFISTTASDFNTANAAAQAIGGHLVYVNDAAENAFLSSFGNFWMGGFQNHSSSLYSEPAGGWEWLDGTSFNYTNWNPGEPNNSGGEDYIQMNAGGYWNDLPNSWVLQHMVEFNGSIVQISGLPTGSTFPIGTTTNSFEVTDEAGNTASCNFDVTVTDNEAPNIACGSDFNFETDPGNCTYTVNLSSATFTETYYISAADLVLPYSCGNGSYHTYSALGGFNWTDIYPESAVTEIELKFNVGIECKTGGAIHTTQLNGNSETTFAQTPHWCTCSAPTSSNIVSLSLNPDNYIVGGTNSFRVPVDFDNWGLFPSADLSGYYAEVQVKYNSITPVVSDNCSIASFNYTLSGATEGTGSGSLAGVVLNQGTTHVLWTVEDVNGNSNSCTQDIIVVDNELPTITCPAAVSVNTDTDLCTASGVALGTPTASDNCNFTISNDAVEPYAVGTHTITWTVTDDSNNSATCEQTVTVTDNQLPEITCPANVSVNTDTDLCTASGVVLGDPTTSDNCSVLTSFNDAVEPYPVGITTITWTVEDVNGNFNTCQQTVTVTDNQLPTIVCPANVSVNTDADLCTASGVALGTPTASDNCNFTVSNDAVEPYAVGTHTITWTITDDSNNSATCEQTVTVTDNQLPVINCPADVLVNTDTDLCTASGVDLGTPNTSDNCDILSVTNDAVEPYSVGVHTITWTVEDVNGNTETCEQTVTVTDNQLPVINCPADVLVNTDTDLCTASGVDLGTPTAGDNCSFTVTNDGVEPYTVGTHIITWTVTDASNNSATCEQTLTVTDNQVPAINCPADVLVNTDTDLCTASGVDLGTPTAGDNCNFTVTNDAVEPYAVGTHIITWTVTDESNNSATCEQTLTVTDAQLPVINCPVDVLVNTDTDLCTASGVDLGAPTTSDNCDILSVTNDAVEPYSVGVHTITWTVEDVNGNTETCEQTVTVTDNQLPVINCPADVLVNTDTDLCTASGVDLGTPNTSDNCDILSVTNDAVEPYSVGVHTITWTVEDVNGNTETCEQTVTVTDNQLPVINCPADVLVNTDTDLCTASGVDLGTPNTSDNCDILSVTNDAVEPYSVGVHTITWTVEDVNGNTETCEQTLTVADAQLPVITCPEAVEVNADADMCTASGVEIGDAVTGDNCGVLSVTNDAAEPYAVGVNIVTWTVEDVNGNTNTCQQSVTVIEEELPEITCPANVSVNTDADLCTAGGIVLDEPITSDNCGIYSVVNDAPETFETGETTVIWTVTDNNGNIATCSHVVTVTDNQAPAIVCPPNVSVPFDEGENTASNVDLGTPETSDNCGIQTVENDAVEPYPVGITTVTWTVTDVNGNTATCTQTVTVYDPIYVVQFTEDGKNFISNYPNPFNNATTIEFGIVHNSKVSITIVDLYGRKIASLFDGVVFEKGVHHFNFNSNSYNLCPGEYIIQLQTGNKMVTNKMMVE